MNQPPSERTTKLSSLFPYFRPYRAHIAQGITLLLITNVLEKLVPRFLKLAVDALGAGSIRSVIENALWVMGLALAMTLTRIPSRTRIFNVGRNIEFDLRNDLLSRLHALGPAFFQRMPTGETMSRAINDLSQVRAMIGFGFLNLINSLVAYPLALFFMVTMSPELTLWALIPYPLLIWISRWASKAVFVRSRKQQEALGSLSACVQEMLSGIRLVRAFNNQAEQRDRFSQANQAALEANVSVGVIRALIWPTLVGIGMLGTLAVLYRGSSMVIEKELTVGELIAFLAYGESLRWPTMGFGYIMAVVQRGRASYGRIREILDAEPDIVSEKDAVAPQGRGHVVVSDLHFAYDDHEVLRSVGFDVPAQSSLAIVGQTGSGKSTLASLLPRLLPSEPGHIFIDGEDITRWPLRALRKAVGFAQQEPFLFSDTVARNVGYALDDPYAPDAMDKIRLVAREACVLEEIDELPAGFDTVVGERGVQLSGGQKQRIALARALLNQPRVLVMDDPLSAVDAKTETQILNAMERAGQGKTMILITNRVAAAKRLRDIVVLDAGRVVERGTHSELLTKDGLYAALARRQQLEEELSNL